MTLPTLDLAAAAAPWPVHIDFVRPEGVRDVRVVAFALGDVDRALELLAERAPNLPPAPPKAVARRRAEFLAGRYAAAMALEALGCPSPWEVGRREDRAPSWPAGFVGSITHGGGLVAAALARSDDCAGIGIDVELVVPPEGENEVRPSVVRAG